MEQAWSSDLFLAVIILDENVMQWRKTGELRFSDVCTLGDRDSFDRTSGIGFSLGKKVAKQIFAV